MVCYVERPRVFRHITIVETHYNASNLNIAYPRIFTDIPVHPLPREDTKKATKKELRET